MYKITLYYKKYIIPSITSRVFKCHKKATASFDRRSSSGFTHVHCTVKNKNERPRTE